MEIWSVLRQRLKVLFSRRRLDQDLDDELAFHLEMRQQKLRSEGMTDSEARATARRAFGNAGRLKEDTRGLWMFLWLEQVGRDLLYAVRSLGKSPIVTTVVVLSLTLGIGANTAIFSLMDTVMLRLLPVGKPEELVTVVFRHPARRPETVAPPMRCGKRCATIRMSSQACFLGVCISSIWRRGARCTM